MERQPDALGAALRPWRRPSRVTAVMADPYVFYTATLVPIVLAVALLARRPSEVPIALAISAAAVLVQLLLRRAARAKVRLGPVAWTMVRLAIPLLYVTLAVQLIGGPALPLLALYIPVVAAAAAIGAAQGWMAAASAALLILGPELAELGSPAAVVLRAVTLAGVAFVLAYGTRRIVAALEHALRAARAAVVSERRRARQLEALDAVGRLLASTGPSSELFETVLDVVVRRFGYDQVSIYLGDAERVELVAQRGYDEPVPAFDPSMGVAGRVMRQRQLAFVPDVAADPDYVSHGSAATSLITAPLTTDGHFLGVLNVETAGARRLDHTDRTLIGILAGRLATAVALGRDRVAIADRARLFRSIGEFSAEVTSALAIDPLSEVVVAGVNRVVEADVVVITILDRDTGQYCIAAVHGIGASVVGHEIAVGDGLAGRAIRDRATVVGLESNAERHAGSAGMPAVPPDAHGVGIPLIRDGVVVGALSVARRPGHPAFTDLELEGLALVASHVALAVANAFLHAEVRELAIRDALTGLYNRRHFDEALDRLIAAHQRERLGRRRPLSAIMFDLDQFGAFNKQHGHQVGDAVLRTFADVLRGRFRAGDLVARLGGEEFVAILDGSDRDAAVKVADEVRSTLAGRTVVAEDGQELSVTVSAGCAELDPADPTRESLLRTADVALFMAKRGGRDRVVAA
jgi:diguanylate cyclase (GGDEF)-like protein